MPVVLLSNSYSSDPLRIVTEELPAGFDLLVLKKASKDELVYNARFADYILASGRLPIDREVVNASSKLKMIQRTGVGTDTLDLEVLKEKGIPVYINQGVNSRSVAEHTVMLMLSVLRRLPLTDSSVKMGKWLKQEMGIKCAELHKKTVGLIGLGNIGSLVAKMLQPFETNVLYFKRTRLDSNEEKRLGISYLPFSRLLERVEILSLHCPLNDSTEKMIGEREIAEMKAGAIIINTSRGRLIDERALAKALMSGHLMGAGLDVFTDEPLSKNNPLLSLDNVVLTPHIGGVTLDSFRRMIRDALNNIRLFEEGKLEQLESKRLKI